MSTYLLMDYGTLDRMCAGVCPYAEVVQNPDFDGDWPKRYFPDSDGQFVQAARLWEHDSVTIDGVKVYWNYDLCYSGGLFHVYATPDVTPDILKKVKAHLRHCFDVVSCDSTRIWEVVSPVGFVGD